MTPSLATTRNPWAWVPSLYFAQGIPFVMVNTVSVIMYKRMGISNTDIAFYTSWLNLPWMIKPLWSPFVDLFGTKRLWTVALQAVVGVLLACVAFTLPMPKFFQYTIAIFWIMAFSSATHDIAADGFYMLGLKEHQQAAFAGVRSTCFRLATITGEGLLVIVAGRLEIWNGGNIAAAWRVTIAIIAVIMLSAAAYHKWILPHPETDAVKRSGQGAIAKEFGLVFAEFFKKKNIGTALAFLLCYRLAEAQLLKMIYPFLLDPRAEGGLGLTTSEVGFIKGTIGVIALLGGGLLGGWLISRNGLRAWLWPMVVIMHLPDLAFVYLAYARAGEHPADQRGRRGRAIRLRIRLHGLHALHDLPRRGQPQDRSLCHLHRLHGHGSHGSRHVQRLAAGETGLPALLHLGSCCPQSRASWSRRWSRSRRTSDARSKRRRFLRPIHPRVRRSCEESHRGRRHGRRCACLRDRRSRQPNSTVRHENA